MNAESVASRSSIDSSNQKRHIARIFTYSELKAATKNFRSSNALGEGGFGKVYKGWIDDIGSDEGKIASNITVAVKVLNQEGPQGHKEWLAEVKVLGQLRHPHLVRLIGYCCENEHRLLVYEYMQLGSLENHLFQRLAFLHKADISVIYRDFKTSNVLLDSDFTAKLSDFGLAKNGPQGDKSHVSTRVMGTYGYAAPEYDDRGLHKSFTGHLTARSDVYSFGVVLVELLTGRQAIDKTRPDGEHNLVEWARPYLRDKWKFLRIIDPRLEGVYSVKEVQMVANLAHQCLSRNPKTRPLMSFVVEALEPLTKDLIPASYTYVADSGNAENSISQKLLSYMLHI
ncbi:hypothetical protein KP509_37G014500 [Ceratopteris richardii]|uniref:non-specific serine/threonine protein kinase n=1 Tax=Ceratopteris richardii TaxID=49495 RepID=A0A8T2Q6I6_CERRI|nr:hypothetical protein KP509_37G014500 [Ceratopteris richardii]